MSCACLNPDASVPVVDAPISEIEAAVNDEIDAAREWYDVTFLDWYDRVFYPQREAWDKPEGVMFDGQR